MGGAFRRFGRVGNGGTKPANRGGSHLELVGAFLEMKPGIPGWRTAGTLEVYKQAGRLLASLAGEVR